MENKNLLYRFKPINFGFVIICYNTDLRKINITLDSIKTNYSQNKYICISDKDYGIKPCKIHEGSLIELINQSICNMPCNDWNFFIFSGNWVRESLDKRFSLFLESDKDILFPVYFKSYRKQSFSLNGMLMHKNSIGTIGQLPICEDNETSKLAWADELIKNNYKLKSIAGCRITKINNQFYL